MKLKELLGENKFGNGTSVGQYTEYADWIQQAKEKCFNKFDEDEDQWVAFEKALARETSEDQVEVFMSDPDADRLHYNSNGHPDGGKTLEFLENFEAFKRAFEQVLGRS